MPESNDRDGCPPSCSYGKLDVRACLARDRRRRISKADERTCSVDGCSNILHEKCGRKLYNDAGLDVKLFDKELLCFDHFKLQHEHGEHVCCKQVAQCTAPVHMVQVC